MDDFRDTSDPYYEDFCQGSCYDLIGFINAPIEMKNVWKNGQKSILYLIALRLGVRKNFTQSIIKIWAKTEKEEPKFTQNWMNLQLCYLKNAKFIEKRQRFGLNFLEFVIESSPGSRFIWLSNAETTFWQKPILDTEPPEDYARKPKLLKESCPFRGYVNASEGSILNRKTYGSECDVHSRTIFGQNEAWCTFSDFFADNRIFQRWMVSEGSRLLQPSRKQDFYELKDGHFYMFM